MSSATLSLSQARALMLASLGLLRPPTHSATKADLLSAIRQIHNLQLDTISVVPRAHLHILWSRLGAYQPQWLDALHAEGQLFESFSHAVCLLPIEYFPVQRQLMTTRFQGGGFEKWGQNNPGAVTDMLAYIQTNGAVKSSDFKSKQARAGWWDWKTEKIALEYLFYRGDVMVARRQSFQRVYDLRERVLPDWDDSRTLSPEAALRQQVLNSVKALGVAREDWVAPYFYLPKRETDRLLSELVAEGLLLPATIETLEASPAYVHCANAGLLSQALDGSLAATHTSLLSPFDPLVTDRSRLSALFGFDYQIECYTPASKRIYGYFVLPILHRGRLIGRLDAKAWRKEKRLQVIKLFLEAGETVDEDMATALAHTLRDYAAWQGLETISIDWSEPAEFAAAVNHALLLSC